MKVALIDPARFTEPYDLALQAGLGECSVKSKIFASVLSEKQVNTQGDIVQHFYHVASFFKEQGLPRQIRSAVKGASHGFDVWRLRRQLGEWKPDVIHFQWLALPFIDSMFLNGFKKIAPIVLTVHDSNPYNGSAGYTLQQLGLRKAMHEFDALIVHTDAARSRLKTSFDVDESVAHIPHGLLDSYGLSLRDLAPPSSETPVEFLIFGKIKPYKGIDIVLRAAAELPDALKKLCRIRVVGSPYMDIRPLQKLHQDLGLTGIVEFDFRFLDDVEVYENFRRAQVLVMPYRDIDASGVLMSAIAAGRPIIASRLGAFAELLVDGEHGFWSSQKIRRRLPRQWVAWPPTRHFEGRLRRTFGI